MKPSEIIKLARRQTWCTEDIVTTEEAYHFLNFVIEDFGADIRNSDSWYWYDVLQIPVTAWQVQYTFTETPWIMSERFPMHKVQAAWIRKPDWKWRDLPVHFVDKVDINRLTELKEPLACFITRTELNLIPAPKESTMLEIWWFDYNPELSLQQAVQVDENWEAAIYFRYPQWDASTWSNRFAWVKKWDNINPTLRYSVAPVPDLWDYLYHDTQDQWTQPMYEITKTYSDYYWEMEEDIFIDKRWHYILVEGLKYWMYGNMWVNFEAARNNSRAFYDAEKIKAIQNIVDRWQLADTAYFPDLNFLNY
jgi:hypothetical protein